jgi:hypothetical protein
MSEQQQQHQSSWPNDARAGFNLVTFAADVHIACIRPFTRSGMGTGGMTGMASLGAMLFIPIYAGLVEAPEMLTYWYAWLAMAIYRRIKADKSQHTEFHGIVWIFDLCVQRERTAQLLEAATMPVLGAIIGQWSDDVGLFITTGVFSFGYRYVINVAADARRRAAAHNARIDMEAMQREFQGRGS